MLSPIDIVRNALIANAAVGASVGLAIYKLAATQNPPMPHIIVMQVSGRKDAILDTVTGGQSEFRISVEIRVGTVDGANSIGSQVIQALDGASPAGTDRIAYSNEAFLYDDQSKICRRIIDFHVALA